MFINKLTLLYLCAGSTQNNITDYLLTHLWELQEERETKSILLQQKSFPFSEPHPKIISGSSGTSFCCVLQLHHAEQGIDKAITPEGSIYLNSEILPTNTCSGDLILSITVA